MSSFQYTAVSSRGKEARGELSAANERDAKRQLEERGLFVVSLEEIKEKEGGISFLSSVPLFGGGLSLLDRYFLFNNLHLILSSGVSAFEAVQIMREDTDNPTLRRVLSNVERRVKEGAPLANGFADFPELFSPLVLNLMRAGEESGTIDETSELIAAQYKQENEIRSKIRNASIYPAIILILSGAVTVFLLTFVVPRIASIYLDAGVDAPFLTQITLTLSSALSNLLVDVLVLAVLVGAFLFLTATRGGKRIASRLFFRLPAIRGVYRNLNLYRFSWTMGALLGSGTSILTAVETTGSVLEGTPYQAATGRVREALQEGRTLEHALREEQRMLFPLLIPRMVGVGEQTGRIDEILIQLAEYYQETFSNKLQTTLTLVEPLLLVMMGLVVGFIAISTIIPIYQLVGGVI